MVGLAILGLITIVVVYELLRQGAFDRVRNDDDNDEKETDVQ